MQMVFDDVHDVQSPTLGDMDVEALRRYGHQVVDWIATYMAGTERYPILSRVVPGGIRDALPQQAPEQPEKMEDILEDMNRLVVPGITHWNSGSFMGYFGLTNSGPGLLGDMLDAAFNVTRMLWRTAPAATELEHVTLDWLRQLVGLPTPLFGMLHHNSAIVHALAAAREAVPNLRIRQKGMAGRYELPRLRLYTSQEAHASVDKAAIVLGIGQEGIRKIGTDDQFRMDATQLDQAIRQDIQHGWRPFAVVATVGTTSTTSVDPVPQIADVCENYGLWLHVDAAYAGAAAIAPDLRWVLEGCERADTLTINPHKWLFTSFGCSAFYTRRPEVLKSALSLTPDYLNNSESGSEQVPNLMDYDFSLPHRFPALKLWMVMRYFGQKGLEQRIIEHCRLAQLFAGWVDASPDFERMAPTPLSVVCFRAHPRGLDDEALLDKLNERVLNLINARGHFFLSHTRLHGKFVIRVAIGNIRTAESHVHSLWEEIQSLLNAELRFLRGSTVNAPSEIRPFIKLPSREKQKEK